MLYSGLQDGKNVSLHCESNLTMTIHCKTQLLQIKNEPKSTLPFKSLGLVRFFKFVCFLMLSYLGCMYLIKNTIKP